MRDAKLKPRGYQQILDLDPAVGLTIPAAGASYALIEAQTADVRWTDDGTTPTAALGMTLSQTDVFWYAGQLGALKFFSATGGINVSYYS
jgi:hypothetical protein